MPPRLGRQELAEREIGFAEPVRLGWLDVIVDEAEHQDEYEERTAVGFQLERLVKRGT